MSRGTDLHIKGQKKKKQKKQAIYSVEIMLYALSAIFRVSIDSSSLMHEDTDAWIASEKP